MAPKPSSSPSPASSNNKPNTNTNTKPTSKPNKNNPPPPGGPTQASFEHDLSRLAAKARASHPSTHLRQQLTLYLRALALLSLTALSSLTSQRALSPVYGGIPSSRWHAALVGVACFAGWSGNLALERVLRRVQQGSGNGKGRFTLSGAEGLLPLLAAWAPMVYFVLGRWSGVLTARWGPVVTEAVGLGPLVAVAAAGVATGLEGADLSGVRPRWLADAAPGLGAYGVFKLAEKVLGGWVVDRVGGTVLGSRVGMQLVLAALYALVALPAAGWALVLVGVLPAVLHTAVWNTHVPVPAALEALNRGLAPRGYAVLDRAESVTGYISVIDNLEQGYRVMRCDHSLLGGEWVKFLGQGQFKGNQVAEPVYGVFAMLEAVRLVKTPKPVADAEAKALVIGLGIGTTPAALVAHGIDTTVVELDPVVHKFASKYFQLPSNHTAVIEDAVSYTARLAADENAARFDYIIHDVFTGGAEPIALFTLEFLQNLNTLLKPDGVVAINYAGDFALPPPRIVVNTIRSVFPACRIFREHPRDEADFARSGRDFTNMVIFCTKQQQGGKEVISFRKPTPRDMLNSPSRQAFLLPQHEVREADFVEGEEGAGILRGNETERLAKWHEMSALGHWTVMRTVLPDAVWEAW